ncbi:asparagine synthase (glutamine-hydrolyzing) [Paucidesulfovibrio longus]|uniref:asparagine synthase (glutamine-hydrolyzing) n=1 Tax=Paucidesulfovibrio longus TaxID=889 RepID=UPI0003B7AA75|nr:asparagine synthase (glutamine-hydrolyzing) [Paucidesulfovibrio longus]
MCGICGIFGPRGKALEPALLEAMTGELAHRGPDGSGLYLTPGLGLGHRRLAILDLDERAAQPMRAAERGLALVYNGEIYNYRELRAELEALGHGFRTTSDTEVVLESYAAWGPACVERFNGMFALALWDARANTLFLARDRYGIKPLYYARARQGLAFASEVKALLKVPGVERSLDLEAVYEYFTFQNLFTDRTFHRGVTAFPAGCRALAHLDAPGELRLERYWDFDFQEPEKPLAEAEYEEEFERLFRQAVQRQLVSDVEVSAFLSGGIDSGAITAIAAGSQPYIKSFTCGFDLSSASGMELNFDERAKAEALSSLFRTEHYEMVLKAGDMERCLPDLVRHIEEPRVGQSYPNYYACKLAGSFCKVTLAGTGGDELFGGYPWRYFKAPESANLEEYVDRYYLYWQRLVPNTALRRIFAPVRGEVAGVWTRDILRDVFKNREMRFDSPAQRVNHSLYLEAKTFLRGLLTVEDKLSMAHGLEVRIPFLDNDLVDFAMRVPVRLKLGDEALADACAPPRIDENLLGKHITYNRRHRNGKLLLRNVLGRFVPENISNGAKQGFSGPDASWFKGESIDYVRSVLYDDRASIYGLMDPAAVRGLVDDHLEGRENRRLFIWSLLYFELWLKTFL